MTPIKHSDIDLDLLNAFRFKIHGLDVEHMSLTVYLPDSLYDAVSFANANPLSQFENTPEYWLAVEEFTTEIITGVQLFNPFM